MTRKEIEDLSLDMLAFIDVVEDNSVSDLERVEWAVDMVKEILTRYPRCRQVFSELDHGANFLFDHKLDYGHKT